MDEGLSWSQKSWSLIQQNSPYGRTMLYFGDLEFLRRWKLIHCSRPSSTWSYHGAALSRRNWWALYNNRGRGPSWNRCPATGQWGRHWPQYHLPELRGRLCWISLMRSLWRGGKSVTSADRKYFRQTGLAYLSWSWLQPTKSNTKNWPVAYVNHLNWGDIAYFTPNRPPTTSE
jgi:hypothetical protein